MQNQARENPSKNQPAPAVMRYADCDRVALRRLLAGYGLKLEMVGPGEVIEGSYWGDEEAGLAGDRLLVRSDTPVHSILHEACHYVCMDDRRRTRLHTDAGGDHAEENAVCYLQVVLADLLPDTGRNRMLTDMDLWGYSFRLGSAHRWFEEDAADALAWLQAHEILNGDGAVTGRLRGT
jgi:hypothetical protein